MNTSRDGGRLPALLAWVVLTANVACVSGSGLRGASEPTVQELLSRSRAALTRRDWMTAQELAGEASRLAPNSEPARQWSELLLDASSSSVPPGLRVPSTTESPRPPLAPVPHVSAGALLYVGVPSLPLVDPPASDSEVPRALALNSAVTVLGVEGGWARVRQVEVSGLLSQGEQPRWSAVPSDPADPVVEGYVEARFLEPVPVDVGALRQRVRTLLAAGSREDALEAMEYVVFAEPWDLELASALHRLALELERLPVAAWAAWTASRQEPVPRLLDVGVTLLYGCRGDVLRADVYLESDVGTEENLALAEVCVGEVDITPPEDALSLANCGDLNPASEDSEARVSEALQRQEADAARYQAELRAYQERLARLRKLHPQGPFLCAIVTNPSETARWSAPLQLFSMPAVDGECSTAGDVPNVESFPDVGGLRVDALRVPYVAPGATELVCLKAPRYEQMFYGAVLAPDAEAARDFVRRLGTALVAYSEEGPSGTERSSELHHELETLAGELPHATVDTKFPLSCNLGCF
ncbi:hypothetical protein ACN28E_54625 [Archangium lansingense]|uniref:hypothetical protein n=1 Tax=Archangium lansingense TaxID=2995310 RepID=UPI003B78C51B